MLSDIQILKQDYGKYQSILPEEINESIVNELSHVRIKLEKILGKDQKMVENLMSGITKNFKFEKFKNYQYVILKAFPEENEQKGNSYFYAHWVMARDALELLSRNVIALYENLIKYYDEYIKSANKKSKINTYLRSHQDFFGVINRNQTIEQYNDNLVLLCKEIDPSIKQNTIYSFKANSDFQDLRQTVIDLLLHGNRGRLNGFPLLRSAIEVFIYEKLFDLEDDPIYESIQINNPFKVFNGILGIIKTQNLPGFGVDTLKRLYDFQSKIIHRGFRTDDYILWYAFHYSWFLAGDFSEIINHKKIILEGLESDGIIKLKRK